MFHIRSRTIVFTMFCLAGLFLCGRAQAASISYSVHVDTSGITGTNARLIFLQSLSSSGSLEDSIAGFSSDGTYAAGLEIGDVTGSFPGEVDLLGDYADYEQHGNLGTEIDFMITMSNYETVTGNQTLFNFYVQPTTGPGLYPQFQVRDTGGAVSVYLAQQNLVTVTYDQSTGGGGGTPVPEPSTLMAVGTCLAGLARLLRRPR